MSRIALKKLASTSRHGLNSRLGQMSCLLIVSPPGAVQSIAVTVSQYLHIVPIEVMLKFNYT